ncbi:non-homologous end-joining factor 1 [Myripristis murdjan]|uniref:non-homologous end-joining factor 1 n=1 Tax=Myripristis murdjan TaxID=586833 RepID=UPI001175F2D0|nr:non-homologous end-joining factor 1 [Myripristis murdjan]
MQSSEAPAAHVLLERPWLPLCISGCQLLAKTWFGDTAYHILLTDMQCVWEERMDAAAIQSRAQELNRRLRAPVKAFFSHLCEVARPCLSGGDAQPGDEAKISLMRQEDGNISMRLKSELAGLPFYWEFHCSPTPVQTVCSQLVRPLLLMSRLLQRQVGQLGGFLLRKDAEIQDYRENGATLSRERLQTEVFEERTHREDFIGKALPQLCSGQQEGLGFDADLQELYTTIVTHSNTRKRKLSEKNPSEEDLPATEGTQPHPVSRSETFANLGVKNQEAGRTEELSMGDNEAVVSSESVEGDREQSQKDQGDTAGAKMADGPTEIQSGPIPADPAERPASKPKKKKVGLFR